jgi:hypothetical protein
MSSLIEELQRDALDSTISVSDLLRKSLVVAAKLNLEEFRAWVEHELNGYEDTQQVPDYRKVMGRIVAFNPARGYIPAIIPDAALAELLSIRYETSSAGTIESLTACQGTTLVSDFAPDILARLMETQAYPLIPQVQTAKMGYLGILDAVRNAILAWSLKLESDGIVGEGMSFSPKEKKLASEQAADLRPVVNYITIGQMENSCIQQGTGQSRQRQTH